MTPLGDEAGVQVAPPSGLVNSSDGPLGVRLDPIAVHCPEAQATLLNEPEPAGMATLVQPIPPLLDSVAIAGSVEVNCESTLAPIATH